MGVKVKVRISSSGLVLIGQFVPKLLAVNKKGTIFMNNILWKT